MADIGDICDFCPDGEHDCIMCPIGNPCLNCEDYDKVNGICKSNGGCAPGKEKRMRTITYTYDEEHPTNRDYLIAVLADSIDDSGASYESVAEYNIDCPYRSYSDCLNEHEGNEYDTKEYKAGCIRCKLAWLDREYDTYPSDDGVWERRTDGEKQSD